MKWNEFTRNCGFYFNLVRVSREQRNKKVKSQYHMFSTMEIEEDIESELSGIFRVKLVAKNITELSLHCDASF